MLARRLLRSLLRPSSPPLRFVPLRQQQSSLPPPPPQLCNLSYPVLSRRRFHIAPRTDKGLQPDSSDPEPPKSHAVQRAASHVSEPADITVDEYHEIADEYIDELVLTLEEKAEKGESGYEVEYSAGVLTLSTPLGTYVLNKQPPNRQIWISSPVSGPKRYDWVLVKGEGQDQKEGTGIDVEGDLRGGQWVYLRDGSSLTQLLKKELDVQMNSGDNDSGR